MRITCDRLNHTVLHIEHALTLVDRAIATNRLLHVQTNAHRVDPRSILFHGDVWRLFA